MIAGGKYCKTIDEILDHLLNSLMIYYVVLEFRKAEQWFQCSLGMFWTCNVHIIEINLLGMFTNLQASMLTRDQLKTQPEGELKTTEWWSQLWSWLLPIKMVYILLWWTPWMSSWSWSRPPPSELVRQWLFAFSCIDNPVIEFQFRFTCDWK